MDNFVFLIISMVSSSIYNIQIPYNEGFYSIIKDGFNNNLQLIVYIIFSLTVYGPFIAYLVNRNKVVLNNKVPVNKISYLKWLSIIIAYPIILFSVSLLITQLLSGFSKPLLGFTIPLWFIPIILVWQIVLCVLLHAWCNVVSYYILAISPITGMTSTILALLTWLLASLLIKKMTNK